MSCEQYFAAIPWPWFPITCLICLVLGALLGIAYERRRQHRIHSRDKEGTS